MCVLKTPAFVTDLSLDLCTVIVKVRGCGCNVVFGQLFHCSGHRCSIVTGAALVQSLCCHFAMLSHVQSVSSVEMLMSVLFTIVITVCVG